MTRALHNPNREHGVWNDIILTDKHTKAGVISTVVKQAIREDWLYSDKPYTRVEQVIGDKLWQLDRDALLREAKKFDDPTCFDEAVPRPLREGTATALSETRWRNKPDAEHARAIAVETIRTNVQGVLDVDDVEVKGAETVSLIVVHQKTLDAPGFGEIMQAIRFRQEELGLARVRVLVHGAGRRQWL